MLSSRALSLTSFVLPFLLYLLCQNVGRAAGGKLHAQANSFGWLAIRNYTYCMGPNPDPPNKPRGIQPTNRAQPLSYASSKRLTGVGDSVVVLYHPEDSNKAIAWCNTLVAFQSTKHVQCHTALPTCQRCDAVRDKTAAPPANKAPSGKLGKRRHGRRSLTSLLPDSAVDASADPELEAAISEFADYCENKLTLAVRADCPLHLVKGWADEPPFDLHRFCMALKGKDGYTLHSGPGAGPQSGMGRLAWDDGDGPSNGGDAQQNGGGSGGAKPAFARPRGVGVVDPNDPVIPLPGDNGGGKHW